MKRRLQSANQPAALSRMTAALRTLLLTLLCCGVSPWAHGQALPLFIENDFRNLQVQPFSTAAPTTTVAIDAGGETTLDSASGPKARLTFAAGSSTYTHSVLLGTTGRNLDDVLQVEVRIVASSNPTVEFRNAITDRPLILSLPGSPRTQVESYMVRFLYNGTAWEIDAQWPPKVGPTDALFRTGAFATAGQWSSTTPLGGFISTRIFRPGTSTIVAGGSTTLGATTILLPSFTPRDQNGTLLTGQGVKLQSAAIGRPIVARAPSFLLGAVIPPPLVKADGSPAPADFYEPKPANSSSERFYWSPNARKVFATQPGLVTVSWQIAGQTGPLSTYDRTYIVSGSSVKPTRRIYWTEGRFNGPKVFVPPSRVNDVKVVYNSTFPALASIPYELPFGSQVPAAGQLGDANYEELRQTLWYDSRSNNIRAYNREGRVFVEYLGNLRADTFREHLDFEIVEVIREVRPALIHVDIGDVVPPPSEPAPANAPDFNLRDNVVAGLNQTQTPFLYAHTSQGGTKRSLYAIRETRDVFIDNVEQPSNEVLIYWEEAAALGIFWPKYYAGYSFKWPSQTEKYSLYARQNQADGDVASTGVQLVSANNPTLVYQDDPNNQHAFLNPQNVFYTNVTSSPSDGNQDDETGRALIRYIVGEKIWFERVRSQLHTSFAGYNSLLPLDVGSRLAAPAEADGMVGYIRQNLTNPQKGKGDAYNPDAYKDPFVVGFEEAAKGAIIGVNALASNSELEVWWYKRNNPPDPSIQPTYWPAFVNRYKLQWPADPKEIVLARNDGTNDLDSLRAAGKIYRQPDATLPGYNPNEEHALMLGGRAYALRDDLNVASSSEPFVLLSYTAADKRPAMDVFKVLRERRDLGAVFVYEGRVATPLQAPAPLPQLPLPVDTAIRGSEVMVRNKEVQTVFDEPVNYNEQRDGTAFSTYRKFTYKDRKGQHWIYRAKHVEPAPAPLALTGEFAPRAVVGQPFTYYPNASRKLSDLTFTAVNLPGWLEFDGQKLSGTPTAADLGSPVITLTAASGTESANRTLALTVATGGSVVGQAPQIPPVEPGNNFSMRYYYKLQAGFDFPPTITRPADGTILPYLRPYVNPANPTAGFVGDPITGEPLDIVFLPVWRSEGELTIAETLALPKNGLPAVRGQSSVRVLYEQSIAQDMNVKTRSVRLFDPTREKTFALSSTGLNKLPDSIATTVNRGKTYFQNLPPHLNQRVFFDRARGPLGALVFNGQFFDETVGEKYFLLNVLSAADTAALKQLCQPSDTRKAAWDIAIDNLQTTMQTFKEDPARLGTFIPDSAKDIRINPNQVAEVPSQDTAVDSYAISASAGGTGYVVLAVGDGLAFQPQDEAVSLHVFKVAPQVYRGEVKPIFPSNPLDEKLTLQHTSDFAGRPEDYEFEWRRGLPVDGLPPRLYSYTRNLILGDGEWRLLNNPTATELAHFRQPNVPVTNLRSVNLPATQIVINDGNGDAASGLPNALLRREFSVTTRPLRLFVSLDAGLHNGARVYLNNAAVAAYRVPAQTDTPLADRPGSDFDPLPTLFEISPSALLIGRNVLTVQLFTKADVGAATNFNVRLESSVESEDLSQWLPEENPSNNQYLIGGSGIKTLVDSYYIMRYRAKPNTAAARATGGDANNPGAFSRWVEPVLAEGWIKRVLRGINPFNQRITDLFNNQLNTDVSIVSQAGRRWEGDIPLTLENINSFGLIEIYETVLNRGKSLSIEGNPRLNDPGANDALLLAAGYLNDLYRTLGDEAFADAANPTIAFGSDGSDFGSVSTALFAFKGQLPSVLEEELALLRGRDDSLQPAVTLRPTYNRLFWNYTRGIDSGEAVYALNYNIRDIDVDGVIDAKDAAVLYPQGHGDAYGHYLTALKGYYGLIHNDQFAWTPRIEAVTVLGATVSVDYLDERKFATTAASLARTASQIVDLTYRQQYTSAENAGWTNLRDGRSNPNTFRVRRWGLDDWASRAGQGAYFNWLVANSTLPDVDPNPLHEGIQKIDRNTVPELSEIVSHATAIQKTLENADGRLNPLGLSRRALVFDLDPTFLEVGSTAQTGRAAIQGLTHFDQIMERAIAALSNAALAFDNAKGSTEFLRKQETSLGDLQAAILQQEVVYNNQLIEIYGTPYTDDIGPGKTYAQGYSGPDLLHSSYIDLPEVFDDQWRAQKTFRLPLNPNAIGGISTFLNWNFVEFTINARGEYAKPATWTGRRAHPGRMQTTISDLQLARQGLYQSLRDYARINEKMDEQIGLFNAALTAHDKQLENLEDQDAALTTLSGLYVAAKTGARLIEGAKNVSAKFADSLVDGAPYAVGLSVDSGFPLRLAARLTHAGLFVGLETAQVALETFQDATMAAGESIQRLTEIDTENILWARENTELLIGLRISLRELLENQFAVDSAIRRFDQAQRNLYTLQAEGDQVQRERETFRKLNAAVIQGYRTKDAAFRAFRNEALEKYKTLFDLAARYTYLTARAYDYDTGLLDPDGNSAATAFYDKIVRSRAIGVFADKTPQFSSSTTGDPGLSGVLAQLVGDAAVVKSRLGLNNPDRYNTTFSLRNERFRIVNGPEGDSAWQDVLAASRRDNILDDPDVRRHCLQVANANGLPVPGLVIEFQTTITDGFNFFGKPLAGGDHTFSPSSFATKIQTAGIGLDGYIGMVPPSPTDDATATAGATSPVPYTAFTDPDALSATPYVYLIPAGVDSMRSPALGDTSVVRTWDVEDQGIPLPFNIGKSDYSTNSAFTSADSLSEPAFVIRKHQAFRALPGDTDFSSMPVQFATARLIGRSVWNSRWKIVIPGKNLLNNPNKGLDSFLRTVSDIKLYFGTYSYSGN